MGNKKIIEVIEFTDPVCTWCWGSEPLLRQLETRYKDQLQVKFIMGGLVKDIGDFYDSFHGIGGDAEASNKQIAAHWLEASQTHGMPVKAQGFGLFSKEHPSTYPQNIAYKAAQMENEELANKFLRNTREATAVESRQTNKTEVLIELASESGLDISSFISRFSDGTAKAAFKDDLKTVQDYGVRGFPTFLIRYGEKEILMRGYQGFDAIQSVIKTLAGDAIVDYRPEKSEDKVLAFIKKYERVAPVEIQTSFNYTKEEVETLIISMQEKNLIHSTPIGNGTFITPVSSPLFCDPMSGICGI